MNKIVPYLWFDSQAEDTSKFYVSLFENSAVSHISRYGKSAVGVSGLPAGRVMTLCPAS
jgi:predicted 3-demethylubiquinone-9 3-methyltransferase (glyoxalase superfamily)